MMKRPQKKKVQVAKSIVVFFITLLSSLVIYVLILLKSELRNNQLFLCVQE
jgi:hypothetical protein